MPPLPVDVCLADRELTEPRLSPDGRAIAYASSQPGRVELIVHDLDASGAPVGTPRSITSEPAPRVGRGTGGGCWAWTADGNAVVYAAVDGDLWHQPLVGPPRRLTAVGPSRAAQAPAVAGDDSLVAFVVDQSEVWCVRPDGRGVRLDEGTADFCFDPAVSPDGSTVAWVEWDVPDMPWDAARLAVAASDGSGVEYRRPAHSVQQPRWTPDGALVVVRDDHGWLNVWCDDRPVVDEPYEHAGPSWGLGQRSFAVSPDGTRVAFTRNERGFGRLCVADRSTGAVTEIGRGVHAQLSWTGHLLAALRSGARTPPEVVVHDLSGAGPPTRSTIAVGPGFAWDRDRLVEPTLLDVATPDGGVVPCRWYAADRDDTPGVVRRVICWVHGGPTDQWQVSFMPRLEFYRSRGWDVVVPDHRGSTGHGRAFQQALDGRWGELDVDDIAAVLHHLSSAGLAGPERTVLMGGSAGGFTVLGVIARHPGVVRAAAVSYPVSDLADLAERSHRFERHSIWRLVARPGESTTGDRALHDRSPVNFAGRISAPVVISHGSDDPVVPVEQSRLLAERITAAGGRADLVVYDGEGHGLRQPANQAADARRTEAFLELHVPGRPTQG